MEDEWPRTYQFGYLGNDIRGTKGSDPSTQVLKHPNPRTPFPDEILKLLKGELAK